MTTPSASICSSVARIFPLITAAVVLTACGGGSDSTPLPPPAESTPPPIPTTNVSITVIDGAIRNALVCVDKNLNGVCDAGETSGKTDAAGTVVLQVPASDAGKYPILAVVGTDAVDADNGPVSTAFVLKAPADRPAVVSPLTTLVQTTIETTGVNTAVAEAAVQDQIGTKFSLFQDFTKGTTADSQTLSTISRLVVVTTQEQLKVVSGAVGTKSIDGSNITQADLNGVVAQKMLEALPALVTALADSRLIVAKSIAENAAAVSAIAKELSVPATSGLSSTTVATLVGIAKTPDASPNGTPAANGTLTTLNYDGALNWFWRVLTSTAAQSTPDASGNIRYVERRTRNVNGVISSWGAGSVPERQSDLHWNGASWVACTLNQENTSSLRDAQGRSTFNYCDRLEIGVSKRSTFDVSGRPMIDVYNQAVGAGFTNLAISNASAALGTATFPLNSKLFYQTITPLSRAPAYSPATTNQVFNVNADVAAGKTSPDDQTSACWAITLTTPFASFSSVATTLESVVAANAGTPCVFRPSAESGPRNEWWSQSTISLGTVGTAPLGGTNSYTTNSLLRVGFGPGNSVKYFACQQSNRGVARNCDAIGTGTYTITSLGDGRVLTLNNQPAQAAALNYQRVFVERAGRIYYGFQSRLTPNNSVRTNLTAANALFVQLGLKPVDAEVPVASL